MFFIRATKTEVKRERARKADAPSGFVNVKRTHVAYYAAWLPGWVAPDKCTRYKTKREAEKDMKKAGSPKGERGWKKSVVTV